MNSEELEISLRTEFESYLNNVRAEMKQELSDFQKMVESEVDKHKLQLDGAFKNFSERLDTGTVVDEALKESVVEHLRLARDDGAQVAASAAAEAEMMQSPGGAVSFDQMRDAIAEISGKTSQSAILKSLTDHCSRFTARGAFFIIKNDNFVGWEVFGKDASGEAHTTRDIHFSTSSDTILRESVQDLRTVEAVSGTHKHDSKFLKSLKFGDPERMFAVPLVARGRGVAVLYADGGPNGEFVQVDAIEALVRVAGLTVELLASTAGAGRPQEVKAAESYEDVGPAHFDPTPTEVYEEPTVEHEVTELHDVDTIEQPAFEEAEVYEEPVVEASFEEVNPVAEDLTDTVPVVVEDTLDDESYLMTESVEEVPEFEEVVEYEAVAEVAEVAEPAPETTDFAFISAEPEVVEVEEEVVPVDEHVEVLTNGNGNGYHHVEEPVAEVTTAPTNGRKRGRTVDLPIEVSADERDKHTKARSFARLLVSEIKLYNPDKVSDGRQSNDLYDRLREAIDRSREMYQQRIDAPVSTRFDYFHYELVNGLAEGDEARLGSSYPGAHS
ncbi:MAG: hypothetical protein ABI878_09660 [Acidobacteriota bacterium]